MSAKQGYEEGCRTYIDETVGKIIVSIILIAFVIALISGILLYSSSHENENLPGNTSVTEISNKSEDSVQSTNISRDSEGDLKNRTVRITELNTTDEYIRLKNYGSEPVNLSGWKVADKNGEHIFTFPNVSLKPQQTITIYSGAYAEDKADQKAIIIWTTDEVWDDAGDQAILYDQSGMEIDEEK